MNKIIKVTLPLVAVSLIGATIISNMPVEDKSLSKAEPEAVVEKQVETIESIDNQVEVVVEEPVYDVPNEENDLSVKVNFDSIAVIINEYLSSNNLSNRYHSFSKYQYTIINMYANNPDMFLQNNYIENTNKCLIQLTDYIEANPNSQTHMFTCR